MVSSRSQTFHEMTLDDSKIINLGPYTRVWPLNFDHLNSIKKYLQDLEQKIELETYSSFCNSGLCPRLKLRLLETAGRKAAARVGRRAATAERVRARRAIEHDLKV